MFETCGTKIAMSKMNVLRFGDDFKEERLSFLLMVELCSPKGC